MPRPRRRRAPLAVLSTLAVLATVLPLLSTVPAQGEAAPSLSRKDPAGDVEVTAKDDNPHRRQARALDLLSVRAVRDGKRIVFTAATVRPVTSIAKRANRDGQLVVTLCPADSTNGCGNGVLVNVPLPSQKLIAAAFTFADDGTARVCPKPVEVSITTNVVHLTMRRACLPDRTGLVLSGVTLLDMGSGEHTAHLQDPTKLSKVGAI
ncbi:hypothetical protein GCM10022215_26010 [Nocardioides fonticola]|uniref:Uncharacterized protein n=1 Tax=Nocardioides fonticola TaxID=450363 RepID=A0ABP7XM13_9ACTN